MKDPNESHAKKGGGGHLWEGPKHHVLSLWIQDSSAPKHMFQEALQLQMEALPHFRWPGFYLSLNPWPYDWI